MEHSFDVDIATKYGILEAILLKNLYYWIKKNEANNQNYFEDKYWTYNSIKAFALLFPYVSSKKIQYTLKKLEEEGLIVTGNFNKSNYDRTLWYAFTKKGNSIMQNCKMDLVNLENGFDNFTKPIPNNKTQIETQITKTHKEKFKKPTLDEVKEYCEKRSNGIDPQEFIDFYESKGWYVGKNKMVDWQASVRTWERNRKTAKNNKPKVTYDPI